MKKMVLMMAFLSSAVFCHSECSPELYHEGNYHLYSGRSHPKLAGALALELGAELEAKPKSIQNQNVYLIQSLCATKKCSLNDALIELFSMARKMKRGSCRKVIAVLSYLSNEFNIKDTAHLIESAGVDRVICFDFPGEKYFKKAVVHNLSSIPLLVPHFAKKEWVDTVVIPLKKSSLSYTKKFLEKLEECGVEAKLGKAGAFDCEGKDLILVDDFCESSTPLVEAAELFEKKGARKIFACVAHSSLSPLDLEAISGSPFEEFVSTDTLPLKGDLPGNLIQVSIAPMVAESIFKIETNRPF